MSSSPHKKTQTKENKTRTPRGHVETLIQERFPGSCYLCSNMHQTAYHRGIDSPDFFRLRNFGKVISQLFSWIRSFQSIICRYFVLRVLPSLEDVKMQISHCWGLGKLCTCNSNHSRIACAARFYIEMMSRWKRTKFLLLLLWIGNQRLYTM